MVLVERRMSGIGIIGISHGSMVSILIDTSVWNWQFILPLNNYSFAQWKIRLWPESQIVHPPFSIHLLLDKLRLCSDMTDPVQMTNYFYASVSWTVNSKSNNSLNLLLLFGLAENQEPLINQNVTKTNIWFKKQTVKHSVRQRYNQNLWGAQRNF